MTIEGKVAVVSGGASGIGRATVVALVERGAKVIIADLDEDGARHTIDLVTAQGGAAIFQRCDVTRSEDLRAAFDGAVDHFGRFDIAFNNAGIGEDDFFADDRGKWKRVVEIDLIAVIDATRLAVLKMGEMGNGGAIVNSGSMVGLWPMPMSPVYAAAKDGVVNSTRSLGYLAAESGIRVNTICPELVDTPMAAPMGEEVLIEARKTGGILKPEQIAAAVLQLIEDESRFGAVLTYVIGGEPEYVTSIWA